MEDLPPLPFSRNSSRAPSEQSSSPELNESHLYTRDFVRETRQRLSFTSTQVPILDDHQLSGLSDGETILVPLSCSALNALASMTRQLDTITTQLGNIQAAVHPMPTWTALESVLTPINAAIRDLSHRVTAPPSLAPPPTRPPVPPTGAPTRQAPAPTRPSVPPLGAPAVPLPRPKTRAPPPNKGSSSSCSFDPDIPRYDAGTRSFYGDPRAYADKLPNSWEANAYREGMYSDPTTFIAGHLAPDCPKPQQSYTKASSTGAPKGKKNKSSLTAAQVALASNSVAVAQPPKSLPTTERRFFVPRSSHSEHQQASLIAATFPDIAARVLREANCIHSLAVTTKVNDRGSVTLLVTDTATPTAAFAPYFDALSSQFDKSFPVGESPWLPFCLAPNEAQLTSTCSPLPSSPRTQTNFFPASRSRSSTPRTFASSPPDISTLTPSPGEARLPPQLSSLSTQGTSRRWTPQYVSFHAREALSGPTTPIGTLSARTAGAMGMSPLDVPPSTRAAPFVPSTIPVPCPNVPTLPALEVGTLRLLLAVALPHHHDAPTVEAPTLRLTGIVTPVQLRPLSGVPPLPRRSFARCNMCTCSGNGTQEWAVQDLLCLVDLYLVYLI